MKLQHVFWCFEVGLLSLCDALQRQNSRTHLGQVTQGVYVPELLLAFLYKAVDGNNVGSKQTEIKCH